MITMVGRRSSDNSRKEWEVLSTSIRHMVSEGDIQEATFDTFSLPFYAPHIEELTTIIQVEGSFDLEWIETFDTDFCDEDDVYDNIKRGKSFANTIRAVVESMIASHFGEAILDKLFRKYEEAIGEIPAEERPRNHNLVICMAKKEA